MQLQLFRFALVRPALIALSLTLALAACGSDGDSADEAGDTTEASAETSTTAAPTTEAPTTEAPTTTEGAASDEMSATQSSLAEQLANADLEEIEALLATEEGRAAFTETVLELAPSLTEEQVGCFLDEFDLTLLGPLQENPGALEPEQLADILNVLAGCEIPLTAFAG